MKAVQISGNIFWVGGIDWDLRNFHGYLTQRGSTYNAYLIMDKEITLIDTVKHYLADEMIERISSVTDPAKIRHIVSNHVEMDHSGSLPRMKDIAPDAVIHTSVNGEKGLSKHYRRDIDYRAVKSGETLTIGERTLTFVHTPMVHWPDNMVTYSAKDSILFSNDAFGQHYASTERFASECCLDIVLEEAKKYYANIVLPYGAQVQKALEALSALKISLIAPSHGLMWKKHIPAILEQYEKWSSNTTDRKATIVYDTMWESTAHIAMAVYRAFEQAGIPAKLYNLKQTHISDIMTDLITSEFICVGSPTLNNNMLPTVAAFLTYMKGLKPIKRKGLAFGSYGWGGQSIPQVQEVLEELKFETMEPVKTQYIPDDKTLADITDSIFSGIKE